MKSPAHTVIYTHGGGRLGNQILRFMHWMAWARAHEEQVEVLDLAFWPYAGLFAQWREHPGCVFPVRPGRADWLARRDQALPHQLRLRCETRNRLARAIGAAGVCGPGWQTIELNDSLGQSIDLNAPAFLSRVVGKQVTVVSGWKIAGWRLVEENQEELRQCLQPHPEWMGRPLAFIRNLRQKYEWIIGIFIRQGDYRVWNGGHYYYSTEQYLTWILQLLDLHAGKRTAVVIASDEEQDSALFQGLPCYFTNGAVNSGGHWFETWLELSLCDLIVSPPSTFSATAAFERSVPLWPLTETDQVLAFGQVMGDPLFDASRHPRFSESVQ